MKIALIGYGKMGREIASIATTHDIIVSATIDKNSDAKHTSISEESLRDADVVIDFSHPSAIINNIKSVAALKKDLVVGTSGWYDRVDEVKKIVGDSNIRFMYSTNFSIGVAAFVRIIESASKLMDGIATYDVFGYELHHNQKADSPSGTATSLTQAVVDNMSRINSVVYEKLDRKKKSDELHFASVRAGSIPGTHVIGYDSAHDTIELKHTARTRAGFALGAVLAAKWLLQQKPGFYDMDSFLKSKFEI